ncbi:MAG: ABC transporter ATP-binding protein [Alphaproteobacteria bacterium]|nr:ABC transporter ATP-binding protein [Alphaproteobacteria bacterium]
MSAVPGRAAGAPGAAEDVIVVEDVTKTFGGRNGVRALDPVSFRIRDRAFVSIIGPSGCGKSTLLRIIGGLIGIDRGRVEVAGHAVDGPPPELGMVFQTANLLPWLDTVRNLRLAAEMRNVPSAEIDAEVMAKLAMLGLGGFERAYPHQLSGGMQQRVALGQALILRPRVLLMDEPFGALDALTRDRLNIELLRIWEESRQTVFLVTHSITEAVFLSDRVLVMSARPGRLIDDVAIDLPHPRSSKTTRADPAFARHVLRLSELMGVG